MSTLAGIDIQCRKQRKYFLEFPAKVKKNYDQVRNSFPTCNCEQKQTNETDKNRTKPWRR